MDLQMILGFIAIAVGVLCITLAAVNRGDIRDYLMGLLWCEWGGLFIMPRLFDPGAPQIGVAAFFAFAMGSTIFMWWKARGNYMRAEALEAHATTRPTPPENTNAGPFQETGER